MRVMQWLRAWWRRLNTETQAEMDRAEFERWRDGHYKREPRRPDDRKA
jgi:hypothetical protein